MNKNMKSRREFLRLSGSVALAGAAGSLLLGQAGSAFAAKKTTPLPIAAKAGGKNVRTVRGLMAPEFLGITDMHEHVLRDHVVSEAEAHKMFDAETLKEMAMFSDPEEVPKSYFPEKGNPITLQNRHYLTHFYSNGKDQFLLDKDLMMGELRDFAALGGQSILDCSPTYERGSPKVIRQMSEETGVNVIMSTGINSHVLLPNKYKHMSVSQLAEFFEKEIHVGIDDTGICCGNIKLLAESEQFGVKATEDMPLLHGLEAAAGISRNSGVPVTVHAYLLGTEVLKSFLNMANSFGMPKGRMILAHFSTALMPMDYKTLLQDPKAFMPDLDIGYWAMDQGFILSFDLFGAGSSWVDTHEGLVPAYDPISLAAIYQYVKKGYGDRIVLGTDLWMRNSTRKYGGGGISKLLNYVVPLLTENGLNQREIDQILVQTPARMLAF